MENWIKNKFTFSGPNLHLHTTWCVDNDGNIWHGNDRNELVKYNLEQKDVDNYSWLLRAVNATIIYCLFKDNNNTIWIGTDNGIIRMANRDAVFANIPFELNGVELKNIRCRRAMADRYNNLYAATENYGLLKKHGQCAAQILPLHFPLMLPFPLAICRWMATAFASNSVPNMISATCTICGTMEKM